MKPAFVNLMGGWIQVVDARTGKPVASYNLPTTVKSYAPFTRRTVKAINALGYSVKLTKGMGGYDVILIGPYDLEPAPAPSYALAAAPAPATQARLF